MDLTHDFGDNLNKKMTAKGVVDVTIDASLKKITTVSAWQKAQKEAEKKLGCTLPKGCGASHVAFLMEKCYKDSNCRWAAYAYINWWPMVFVDPYGEYVFPANYLQSTAVGLHSTLFCLFYSLGAYPSVVTHEIGVSHKYFVKIFAHALQMKISLNSQLLFAIEPNHSTI